MSPPAGDGAEKEWSEYDAPSSSCGGEGGGAEQNSMETFAKSLAGDLGMSGGCDRGGAAAAAVDACIDALVLETCTTALAPHPPDRPNSRGARPTSVASNNSVSREVNTQMGDLTGGLFDGETKRGSRDSRGSEPFVPPLSAGGAPLNADERERELQAARATAKQKVASAKAKAEEAGAANARERRESEVRRAGDAAVAERHRREAAAVQIQATWRGEGGCTAVECSCAPQLQPLNLIAVNVISWFHKVCAVIKWVNSCAATARRAGARGGARPVAGGVPGRAPQVESSC
jgi:hypothetical protein